MYINNILIFLIVITQVLKSFLKQNTLNFVTWKCAHGLFVQEIKTVMSKIIPSYT